METEEKVEETNEVEPEEKPRRLCSEIQLFDLCERDQCSYKDGRFCTNEELLKRFEAIKEEDERASERFLSEDYDDESEGADEEDYDDSYGDYEDDDSDDV